MVEANRAVVKRFGTSPTVGVKMVEFRRRNVRWLAWDMSGQGGGAGCLSMGGGILLHYFQRVSRGFDTFRVDILSSQAARYLCALASG